jgi:hypothetical protein
MLKPIVESVPAIIHGTKDLAIKLSKLNIDTSRKWFLVTGDVVAFYPHIPVDVAERVATEAYQYCYGKAANDDPEALRLEELFIRCLAVSNNNLVVQFKDQYYKQKQGLAMGVASAPDLAQLYGWKFECVSKILENPLVAFYGRFIDDIFAIVYAQTELEALNICKKVEFYNCTIEWNVSDHFVNFLDMTIYRDEYNRMQHMPFRKARSHMERIPWISHHPLDVKRGTYIGEMSRLATLCSLDSHYGDAIKALLALYIARGYPSQLVRKWTKENFAKRWQSRLSEKPTTKADDHEHLFVLKTVFNTAWDYFNAKEVENSLISYWREWLARAEDNRYSIAFPEPDADLGDLAGTASELCLEVRSKQGVIPMPDIRKIGFDKARMIVSRKRTRNLFDLTNLWKKTVLETLDRDASDQRSNDVTAMEVDEEGDSPKITQLHRGSTPPSDDGNDDFEYRYLNFGTRQLVW